MLSLEEVSVYISVFAYGAMFLILVVSAMGLPIPEELVLIASGMAIGWGKVEWLPTVLACVAGIVAGDVFVYFMSRYHARRFLALPPFCWIFSEKRQQQIQRLYDRHGGKTVFFGRFVPAVRFGVLVFAGRTQMPWRRFLALDSTAAFLSGPLAIGVGWWAARSLGDPRQAGEWAQKAISAGNFWLWSPLSQAWPP
jgi:membrane protein DedA with SNARE-associated domain